MSLIIKNPKYYNESQKEYIYTWNSKNKDKIQLWKEKNKEIIKQYVVKWRSNTETLKRDKENRRVRGLKYYYYKQECKRLCSILLY
jgi:hypothetical protein